MKNLFRSLGLPSGFPLLVLAKILMMLTSLAQAQIAVSTPRGIYTVKIPGQEQDGVPRRTYVGIQLLPGIVFSGFAAAIDGNTITLAGGDHASLESTAETRYIHVFDGDGEGFVVDIVDYQDDHLVCAQDLTSWISAGTRVAIRRHHHLEEIFGTSNHFQLDSGTDPDLTDNVVVFDPELQRERVYYFNSLRSRWEEKGETGSANQALIRFPYGLYIVRRTPGTLRMTLSGNVVTQSVLLPLHEGLNILSPPINLSASLSNWISVDGPFSVSKGSNASSADLFTVHEASRADRRGPFYYSSHIDAEGWRKVGVDGSSEASQSLDFLAALVVRHQGAGGYLLAKANLDPSSLVTIPPEPEPGEPHLTAELGFPQLQPNPSFIYRIEKSVDLQNWATHQIFIPIGEKVSFTVSSGQTRFFYRIAVVAP